MIKFVQVGASNANDACYRFVKDKDIGMSVKHMADGFIESMDGAFEYWKPKEKYTLEAV